MILCENIFTAPSLPNGWRWCFQLKVNLLCSLKRPECQVMKAIVGGTEWAHQNGLKPHAKLIIWPKKNMEKNYQLWSVSQWFFSVIVVPWLTLLLVIFSTDCGCPTHSNQLFFVIPWHLDLFKSTISEMSKLLTEYINVSEIISTLTIFIPFRRN